MNIILFDHPEIRQSLLPLTYTRPVGNLRVGILTIDEKWGKHLQAEVSFRTESYLSAKFPITTAKLNIFINGGLCPDGELLDAIRDLEEDCWLMKENIPIALKTRNKDFENQNLKKEAYQHEITLIDAPWKIFKLTRKEIERDFILLTEGRKSAVIDDPHTVVYGEENIFIEEGVKIKAAVINAETGPVYLGKNSEIQEGAVIRGSLALCEGGVINMGAKMRGDSTIGPYSKVGGEVSNSVIQGYSNKGHDGFMGNSVLGEWCNLGADTNTSNLKNNYADVKLWSFGAGRFVDTGETFCGLIMGDHSKCGINTMFNTGTVVGVSGNIYGSGFPRNFIPSFAWGGASGFTTFKLNKVFEVAEKVMARRNKSLDDVEKDILKSIFEQSEEQRFWEKR